MSVRIGPVTADNKSSISLPGIDGNYTEPWPTTVDPVTGIHTADKAYIMERMKTVRHGKIYVDSNGVRRIRDDVPTQEFELVNE